MTFAIRIRPFVFAAALCAAAFVCDLAAQTPAAPPVPAALRERGRALSQQDQQLDRTGGDRAAFGRVLIAFAEEAERAGADSLAAEFHGRAAWTEARLGRMAESAARFAHALQIAERHGEPNVLLATRNMAATQRAMVGDLDGALVLWAGVLALRGHLDNPDRLTPTWNNVATAYANMGRLPEALAAAESAFVLPRRASNPRGIAATSLLRSRMLRLAGRIDEALVWNDSALVQMKANGELPGVAAATGMRGVLLGDLGRHDEAMRWTREALEIEARMGAPFPDVNALLTLANGMRRAGHADSARALAEVVLSMPPQVVSGEMRARAAATRATAVADLLPPAEAEPMLRADLAALEELRRAQRDPVARVALFSRGGEIHAALARVLIAQGRTAEAWAVNERGRTLGLGPEFGDGQDPLDVLPALQARLDTTRAAVLAYDEARVNRPVCYVITADSVIAVPLQWEGDGHPARRLIELMASGASDGDCREPLAAVGAALLGGVAERLPAAVERVHVVQPSAVAGLPLEALPLADGRALGERFAVSYLPATLALPALDGRAIGAGPMVVVADPSHPDSAAAAREPLASAIRGVEALPLPHARTEAKRVAASDAVVLIGADADRAHLLAALGGQPAVVHFATHAVANPVRPERSALLLAGEPGPFTAADVESLALAADLVSLSGCKTGGGFTYLGDGTHGLARSFLVAGARSVVMSLWDVDDRAAERFMRRFYRELREGRPRDEALRRAREAMGSAPHRDRSAFVLVGAGSEPVASLAGQPDPGGVGVAPWVWMLPLAVVFFVLWMARRRTARGR